MLGLDFTRLPDFLNSSILDGITKITKDHLGYRFKSLDEYNLSKEELLINCCTMISEEIINGRPCSYRKLKEAIEGFEYLELQAPRSDEPLWTGLEHTEYVPQDIDEVYTLILSHQNGEVGPFKKTSMNHRMFKATKDGIEIKFVESSHIV